MEGMTFYRGPEMFQKGGSTRKGGEEIEGYDPQRNYDR